MYEVVHAGDLPQAGAQLDRGVRDYVVLTP